VPAVPGGLYRARHHGHGRVVAAHGVNGYDEGRHGLKGHATNGGYSSATALTCRPL